MIAWIPFYQAVIYFYQILDIVQNHNFFTFFKMQYKIKKKFKRIKNEYKN